MTDFVRIQRPSIDETVWRPTIPLVVLERCENNSELAVWIALRWLIAAFPKRKGFGRREIARRARVSQGRVVGYIEELIKLGLIKIVGEEQMGNLAPRPIYSIDMHNLERISSEIVLGVLASWGVHTPPSLAPPEQMQLALSHTAGPDRVQNYSADNLYENQTVSPAKNEADPPNFPGLDRVQRTDPPGLDRVQRASPPGLDGVQTPGLHRVHIKEGVEGGRELTLSPDQDNAGDPLARAEPPSLVQMWHDVCPAPRAADRYVLEKLIAEYGEYWVRRAIQSMATNPIRKVTAIQTTLERWRDGDSWGSDAPSRQHKKAAYEQQAEQRPRAASERRRDGSPASRPTSSDRTPPWADSGGSVLVGGSSD